MRVNGKPARSLRSRLKFFGAPAVNSGVPRVLLKHKLMAVMAGTIIVIVAAVSAYFSIRELRGMEQQLSFKGATYAELASHSLTSAIAFDDIETARETFEALREDEDVQALGVFRSGGGVLLIEGALTEIARTAGAGVSKPIAFVVPGALVVARPIRSREGPSGTVVLQLSTSALHQSQSHVIRSGVIAGLLAIVLGLCLSWLAARSLTRRLDAIAAVAEGVANGELDQPHISDDTGDEVGSLAVAVNWMVRRLRQLIRQMSEAATSEQERLGMLVAERTEQLQASELNARRANRAKSAFLAKMSHEIRTPLNGVIGVTNVVLSGRLDPRQRMHLEIVRSSADTLLALVNDVLDYSKIEAGELMLDPVDFSLRELLEQTTLPLRCQLINKDVAFELACDARVPDALYGDNLRLGQVLRNLVHNAMKFTETGFVKLEVRHEARADGEVALWFAISDSGIGISEEARGTIFSSFRQASETVNRQYGGTGLGLAISQQLVELMGGRICIESELGEGSCFHFKIKCRHADKPEALVAITTPPAAPSAKPSRVLVVEDNAVNQLVSRAMLEAQGHTVIVAGDGREAVMITNEESIDVVLMDVQMPVMDGYAATRAIRAREPAGGRHIPIIALTAHAFRADLERCRDAGMDEYLSKPVTEEKLREVLGRVLTRPQSHAPGADHQGLAF